MSVYHYDNSGQFEDNSVSVYHYDNSGQFGVSGRDNSVSVRHYMTIRCQFVII